MTSRIYNLMLRSFDDPLSKDEQSEFEAALADSEELRALREEIVRLRAGIQSSASSAFRPFFAERVLQRISRPKESLADCFVSVFRRVAVGAALIVVICASYNLSRGGALSLESALGIHPPTIDQALTLEAPFE